MKKLGFMAAILMLVSAVARGETLAVWENDNLTTSTNSTPVDATAADMAAGDLKAGPGFAVPASAWDNALDVYISDVTTITNLAEAIGHNRYYSFTTAPSAGKQANYTNIAVRVTLNDSNNAGASVRVVLMSSATGFQDGDEIGSFVASTPAGEITDNGLINLDVSDVAALQGNPSEVEFRLYVVLVSGSYSRVALGHIFFEDGAADVQVEGTTEDATSLPVVTLAMWDNDNVTEQGARSNAVNTVAEGISASDLALSARWFNDLAPWPNSIWALCSDLPNVTNLASAIVEDRYFNLFVKPEPGKQADYTKVAVRISMNSAGNAGTSATFVLMSSVTGFNPGDEIGSFVAVHNPSDGAATDNGLLEMDISSVAALQNVTGEVEFRVYLVLNDGNSNRWGIGHIFYEDAQDDVLVEGRIEDADYVPATILGLTPVSDGVMKMVIDAPGPAIFYYPKATTNLRTVPWAGVAHSDNPEGPFDTITNLSVSAEEGGNRVIYVESTEATKFFGIGSE